MTSSHRPLILGSASPRRREILSMLGIEIEVEPSHADEGSLQIEDPIEFARRAALMKLLSVIEGHPKEGAYVLAADTIVCIDAQRLGKPSDDRDALRMLGLLAGRSHLVRTAVALGRVGEGALDSQLVETRVWFREATRDELERYVASGECHDKAGAYGIQGLASGFVTRIEGSYSNVVGLPAAETVTMLVARGALDQWP